MPPCFQTDLPFGAHIGGTSPQFWAVKQEAEFDSWLTVALVHGNTHSELSAIGIDFESWSPTVQLYADNGGDSAQFPPIINHCPLSSFRLISRSNLRRCGFLDGSGQGAGVCRES